MTSGPKRTAAGTLDHFGLLAPFYERFIRARTPERLLQLTDIPAGGMVLDAAGGTGRIGQFLCERAAQVVVADELLPMLREAGRKSGLRAAGSQTEHLPFPAASFDRIIMVDAMHHVVDQSGTALELWRILRPGGRIVIEEPDVRVFGVKLMALAEKLALMRSHFITPLQIASFFPSPDAHARLECDGATAWVVVDKDGR